MNMFPLITIIIPVYNTEDYLDKCLDSVLNQSYKNIEIIVVDDASQGNVKQIITEYQKFYNNIRLISHEKNKGLFLSRITGAQNARGEFLAFLDSDDSVSIDVYRKMVKKALETEADIVITDYIEVCENGTKYFPNNTLQQINLDLYGADILNALMNQQGLDYGWWVIWNKIYSKDLWRVCWEHLKNINEHLIMCEDIAFSITFFTYAKHLTNIHHDYYYYYRNANSSTKSINTVNTYFKNLSDIQLSFGYSKKVLINSNNWITCGSKLEAWLNILLKYWNRYISEDKNISRANKKVLLEFILKVNNGKEIQPFNDDEAFFSSHGVIYNYSDKFQEIKKAILDPKYKVISFDIFDTLILRPFWRPTDLFHILDNYVNKLIKCTDFFVFTAVRISAEEYARKLKHLTYPVTEEVSIDDIYNACQDICPLLEPYLNQIKEKELELEVNYCYARSSGKELYELAKFYKKKVILVSDIYLPNAVIKKIFKKNGIDHTDEIYLSSDIGLTKGTGNLYAHVQKRLGIKPNQIMHIGDNRDSDINQAQVMGWHAFHLPKTVDVFSNNEVNIYSGQYFYKMFDTNLGYINGYSAMENWGHRCMLALAANDLFDNPFVIYDHNSDFNTNPYTIGYFVLGMYIFSISHWLMKETVQEQYAHLHFIARDGYLPMEAFKILNEIYKSTVNLHYTFMSRKAILPLMLQQEIDYYTLYDACNNLQVLTPEKFINLFKPMISKDKYNNAQKICEENNYPFNGRFKSVSAFELFGKIFLNEFYEPKIFREYLENMKNYLDPDFAGKVATFDIGYNGRIESILSACYGYNITAHYIHVNNDRPFSRAKKNNVEIKTLYNFSPFVTGIMREHLLSKLAPSCIGYDFDVSNKGPLFEDYKINYQTYVTTTIMQSAAIKYVKNMVEKFGDDIKIMPFRNFDACIPMEYYIHASNAKDRHLFSATFFEDDMGIGRKNSLFDFWDNEIHRKDWVKMQLPLAQINYSNMTFIKRWFLIFALDWSEGKKRIAYHLRNHSILLGLMRKLYRCMRSIFRFIHKK